MPLSLQQKFLSRHVTALLNMNGLKHEHKSMNMNISEVWRIWNLPVAAKINTGLGILSEHLTLTQLAHIFSLSFACRFFVVQFKLIMTNWPKSSLSKRKREVQHNLVTYVVIFLPKHQLGGLGGGSTAGEKDLGESVGRRSHLQCLTKQGLGSWI